MRKVSKIQRKPKKEKKKNQEIKFIGRPRKSAVIDDNLLDSVFRLAQMKLTKTEIYATLHIEEVELTNKPDLREKFDEAFNAGSNAGNGLIKQAQFKAAVESGNPSMLIWLGKQHCKQSDNPIENSIASDLGTLKVEFVNAKEESQEERIKKIEDELDKELK